MTSTENYDWYHHLNLPNWTPPDWVFAPIWLFLYSLIAVALIWFLRTGNWRAKKIPLIFFAGQLALNLAWTPLFFGEHKIAWALVEVSVLWCLIGLTIISFYRHCKIAAILLLPYWLWVTVAVYLNFAIWRLNG